MLSQNIARTIEILGRRSANQEARFAKLTIPSLQRALFGARRSRTIAYVLGGQFVELLALLLVYMPFTNMMHFFAKWFTFHMVRWDDAPNLRGSNLEWEMGPLLNQPVSWSAPHIQSIKHWADVAKTTSGEPPARSRIGQAATEENAAQTEKGVG